MGRSILLIALILGGGATTMAFAETSNPDDLARAREELRQKSVASWDFDEGQGDTLHDNHPGGHDGVIHGARWVNGISGKALEFRGEDWVEISGGGDLEVKSFTFSVWLWQSGNAFRGPLMEFQKPGEMVGVHLWANTNGYTTNYPGSFYGNVRPLDASLQQPGSYRDRNLINTQAGMAPGARWNHVVFTFDQSTGISALYLNGKLRASNTFIKPLTPRTVGPLFLGIRSPSSLDWDSGIGLVGILDQADVFDFALSPKEIGALYGQPVTEPKHCHLGMKTHLTGADHSLTLPVYVSMDEADSIFSLKFNLHLDTSVVSLVSMEMDTSLAGDWKVESWDERDPTAIPIHLSNSNPRPERFEGRLVLFHLKTHPNALVGASSMLTLTDLSSPSNPDLELSQTSGKVFVMEKDTTFGDIDGNQEVEADDAGLLLGCHWDKVPAISSDCPVFDSLQADVSGNGELTGYDAALVLQYGLGIREDFPVTEIILPKRASGKSPSLSLGKAEKIDGKTFRYHLTGKDAADIIGGDIILEVGGTLNSKPLITTDQQGLRLAYAWDAQTGKLAVSFAAIRKLPSGDLPLLTIEIEQESENAMIPVAVKSADFNEGEFGPVDLSNASSASLWGKNGDDPRISWAVQNSGRYLRMEVRNDVIQAWSIYDSRGRQIRSGANDSPSNRLNLSLEGISAQWVYIRLLGKSGQVISFPAANPGW